MATITPLKRAIFESGRHQYEIAAAVEISESHLSLIVAGRRHPSKDLADRLSAELGRTVDELWPDVFDTKAAA